MEESEAIAELGLGVVALIKGFLCRVGRRRLDHSLDDAASAAMKKSVQRCFEEGHDALGFRFVLKSAKDVTNSITNAINDRQEESHT